ncbi:MAG: hypothetical protein M1396_06065 [Chloroflexi bacterium]|nr:hypothetical protein [Chloroflexota bacterium]
MIVILHYVAASGQVADLQSKIRPENIAASCAQRLTVAIVLASSERTEHQVCLSFISRYTYIARRYFRWHTVLPE